MTVNSKKDPNTSIIPSFNTLQKRKYNKKGEICLLKEWCV